MAERSTQRCTMNARDRQLVRERAELALDRRVDSLGDLTERLHEKGIGGPPGRKCLLVPLAALIEVVGDPGGLGLTAGGPCAFTDGCH